MTSPSTIVVSHDIAEQLQQALFPQHDSLFVYIKVMHTYRPCYRKNALPNRGRRENVMLAAPTIGEIIKEIPTEKRKRMSVEHMHDANAWAKLWMST